MAISNTEAVQNYLNLQRKMLDHELQWVLKHPDDQESEIMRKKIQAYRKNIEQAESLLAKMTKAN